MKITFKQSIKILLDNIKVAFKDTVDLSMFIVMVIFSAIDISGVHLKGAIGFITFYVFFLLIRLSIFKQENERLNNK